MRLKDYILEYVSSGRGRKPPTIDNILDMKIEAVKGWLTYKGYPDLTPTKPMTQYLLQKKFVGFYEDVKNVLSIVNGDGVTEYRIFFNPKMGYVPTSIMTIKNINGKLDVFNVECDKDSAEKLIDWLNSGHGIRESVDINEYVSSGRGNGKYEIGSIISLDKFDRLLVDSLGLRLPMEGLSSFLSDRRNWTDAYTKIETNDGNTLYNVVVPIGDKCLIWDIIFDGNKLSEVNLYSYFRGKDILETSGSDAANDLIEYLNCKDYKEIELWKKRNA
jgi:hypothetical protein